MSKNESSGILKEHMILQKTHTTNLRDVRNLNMWGFDLTNVDIISKLDNIETLSLSLNKISSLAPFAQCDKLQNLYLRENNIQNLSEIDYLANLPNLTALMLRDNPIASHPNYRIYIAGRLPRLKKLDDIDITEHERELSKSLNLPNLPSNNNVNSNINNNNMNSSPTNKYNDSYGNNQTYNTFNNFIKGNNNGPGSPGDSRTFDIPRGASRYQREDPRRSLSSNSRSDSYFDGINNNDVRSSQNSRNYNQNLYNTANYNTGNYNTGNYNTSPYNTGNFNTGNYNSGNSLNDSRRRFSNSSNSDRPNQSMSPQYDSRNNNNINNQPPKRNDANMLSAVLSLIPELNDDSLQMVLDAIQKRRSSNH